MGEEIRYSLYGALLSQRVLYESLRPRLRMQTRVRRNRWQRPDALKINWRWSCRAVSELKESATALNGTAGEKSDSAETGRGA